eukprot:jgi/Ulvmu1/6394/UM003_0022.1
MGKPSIHIDRKDWSAAWRSSLQKLRSSGLRTLSLSSLVRRLDPNRYNGMDRWMVKGVKKRIGSAMSVMLYDMALWQLTACVVLGYVAVSFVFTVILWLSLLWDPSGFTGEPPGGMSMFVGIFCMSLEALSQTAVSLTDLMPCSASTITIVTIAHFVGILMGAVLLGVLINKASIPSARVVFSDVCLLTSRNGEPMLILRIGNTRGNFLLNPEIRVGYLKLEATVEGENIMRMARIELDEPPAMAPCINIACPIGPDSPLWGKTYADLENEGAAIYVALAATDNQHFQEVYARRFYLVQDMRFNCRFMDIMRTDPSGSRLVDFRRFNTVIQNTIMPVSYGLTYEETLIVNGDSVLKPQAPRSNRSGGPSRSSSRTSLTSAATAPPSGRPGSGYEHLNISEAVRAPSGTARSTEGGSGPRRLWRRGGGRAQEAEEVAAVPDALGTLGKGGLEVQEGSGLPDADGLARSGEDDGSSGEDDGSPAALVGKEGSLLPEPDGDMGGITFNARQVGAKGPASKLMTRSGVFKQVDSDGNSVDDLPGDSTDSGGHSPDTGAAPAVAAALAKLQHCSLPFRAPFGGGDAHDADDERQGAVAAAVEGEEEGGGGGGGGAGPVSDCSSAEFGPELDPVAKAQSHGKKRSMKIEGVEVHAQGDKLAPQPETEALIQKTEGRLFDHSASTARRAVLGVGAVRAASCDEGDGDDCGEASDPETSDAPELHMHEGRAAAAPVPRLKLQKGRAQGAPPMAVGDSARLLRPHAAAGVQARADAAAERALAAAAPVRAQGGARPPPEGAGAGADEQAQQPAQPQSDAAVADRSAAATGSPLRQGAGGASAGKVPPPVVTMAIGGPATRAADGSTGALPAQWREGGSGDSKESVRMSGALRAVLGARRWRARAIATVPEAAVLEGEGDANGNLTAEQDSAASDSSGPASGHSIRGCSALRATLLGGSNRPFSSQLLSANSVSSRTSSDAHDVWGLKEKTKALGKTE